MADILADINELPYRTKFRRTKLPKIRLDAENFVHRKVLSAENFVRRNILSTEIWNMSNLYKSHVKTYFSCELYGEIKIDEKISSDKTTEIST